MHESSGSQFFRTTTGIQSGPDAFNESRFVMNFLTILGVTEILYSFRLLLQGKTCKEIPKSSRLELLGKFLVNNFCFIRYRSQNLQTAEQRRNSRFNFVVQKSREPSFWEVMDSFVLVAHSSLAGSRTLLQRLLACLYLTSDSEDLFCWCKQKK